MPIFVKKPTKQEQTVAKKWDWPLQKNDGIVALTNNSERFRAELEIAQFKPNEIEVVLVVAFAMFRLIHWKNLILLI